MKIGLMGGTFNPIHMGHLIISEFIRVMFPLDKVIFIPSGLPPHKDNDIAEGSHRMAMVKLAINSNPYFDISQIELNRVGKSYTVDTIEEIKNIYPDNELYFIIGSDSLLDLTSWKDFESLVTKTNFLVYGRKENSEKSIIGRIDELKNKYNSSFYYIRGPLVEISSTLIRDRIKNQMSIKYLVPGKVEKYIYENHLYKGEDHYRDIYKT
ncbi:nicotinate-nucleotide adenylyltransferase [Paratissierella segnis]|uniref:Probable nicotinate-nucleotide adenylyltransferase n=1 Tax=Paratissierella segnis TaxID=2763679 RepID=A0A926ES96_9FIRM|nr:nicotinate-nucleotide adenylyltransferase [Paratissierella segnis]MBC8588828.1 nicotinate-nucleotide adenylyltransferase [Paratissierella segnis]